MKCVRTVGVSAVVAIVVMLAFGIRVEAETVAWSNPTTYTDGSSISATKQAQLSTEIQYRIPPGTYVSFGSTTGGASTFTAPYVTPGGVTSYWRMRSISVADNNATSVWSTDFPFGRAYQAPVAGSIQSVQ